MKLLILILGANDELTTSILKVVNETWSKDVNDNIRIMTYYGSKEKDEIIGNNIYLTTSDEYGEPMIKKTLDAFQMAYDNIDFDIMFRTNASNYIRTKFLYKILSKFEAKDLIGSTYPNDLDLYNFAGQGMILSKDVVKKILDNRDIPLNFIFEDQAIQHILEHIYKDDYRKYYKNVPRIDLVELNCCRLNDSLFSIIYGDKCAFRVKTAANRNEDITKIKKLRTIFNGN